MAAVLLLLVLMHFILRPFLAGPSGAPGLLLRGAPDFLLLALLVYAIRARPGRAAVAGFVVGVLADSLAVVGDPATPVAFGAGALAHSVVGYLAAGAKAVFFTENLIVNAGFFLGGTWMRDLLVLVVGGHVESSVMWWQLAFWSPIKALTTAVVGVAVLMVFRRWLQIRITG